MTDESVPAPAETPPLPARKSFPPRVPTLCRLTCQGFEIFFSDRADEPRMPGLIPRAIVAPWWNGVTALCGAEMEKYERRLKTLIGTGEFDDADQLAIELQKAAIGWTSRLLEELGRAECPQNLKQMFENPLLIADLREIARILPMSAALKSRLAISFSLLDEAGQMEGQRIHDLSSETVAMLKGQYLTFAEKCGADARYMALALTNRLARPWQILTIARGLSWRPNEPGSPHAELDAVASRLVMELRRLCRDMTELAKSPDLARDMGRLQTLTAQYLDLAAGLDGNLSLRADAPGAEAIKDSHQCLAAAFDRAFLDRVAAVVFDAERQPGPELAETATAGARFLALLLEQGGPCGVDAAARDAASDLAQRIGNASQTLIESMRATPNYSLFSLQLQALLTVTEIIFKDGKGAQLARNLRMARPRTAA